MPFFEDAEKSSLQIQQMIFHIVGPFDDPILLEPVKINEALTGFFIERILSGNVGNRYEFKPGSSTRSLLADVHSEPKHFAELSKTLATNFHKHHRRSAIPGAFLIFTLKSLSTAPLFALLKYDDDQAIEYGYSTRVGRNEATLRFLERTFVRKPEAMQKLAIIRLAKDAKGELAVRDRGHSDGISEYFEKFLDVRRVQAATAMTQKLQTALQETLKAYREGLPDDVKKDLSKRIATTLQRTNAFVPDNADGLLGSVLGGIDFDPRIAKHFRRRLAAHDIDEEGFKIEKAYITRPRSRRIETVEGVRITFDEDVKSLIKISRNDRGAEITISTERIAVDDYDTQNSR